MKNRMSVARCCCVSTGGSASVSIIIGLGEEATWDDVSWERAGDQLDDPKIGFSGAEYMQSILSTWDGVLPGATTITGCVPSGTTFTLEDPLGTVGTPTIRVELIQGTLPGDQAPSPTPLPTPVDSFNITPSYNAGTNRWEYVLSYIQLLQLQLDNSVAPTFFQLRATWSRPPGFGLALVTENLGVLTMQLSDVITEISYV